MSRRKIKSRILEMMRDETDEQLRSRVAYYTALAGKTTSTDATRGRHREMAEHAQAELQGRTSAPQVHRGRRV